MAKLQLSALSIYPLKSARAISLTHCEVGDMGLDFDRRFIICDNHGLFITGRTEPKIALITVELAAHGIILSAPKMPLVAMKYSELGSAYSPVTVWGAQIQGQHCSAELNLWLCQYLQRDCQLLYFGEQSQRFVKRRTNTLSFADGYPLLLISQASLDELNRRCPEPVDMSQFRTNLVVSGCEPFAEDSWKRIRIGGAEFEIVKACERCIFTTLKPNSTEYHHDREPLKTMSQFRQDDDGRIDFGQNLICHNRATLAVGDSVEVIEYQQPKHYPDKRLALPGRGDSVSKFTRAAVITTPPKTSWHRDETRQLRCVAVIDETHDSKTFRFTVQPAVITDYKPGQFVTLHLKIGQQLVTRNYTLSSSPSRPDLLAITVKRVSGGKASNWLLDNLQVGDSVGASSPRGPFHAFTASANKLLLLSAGSGITPMLSMVRYFADTQSDKDILFFYSAQTAADLIALDELRLLARQHKQLRLVFTLTQDDAQTSWVGYRGRIDQQMLADVVRDIPERAAYVCGPDSFMQAMQQQLTALGLAPQQYFQESFGDHQHSGKPSQSLLVQFDSWETEFVGNNKATLLEQAENHGVNIPYNCRAGYCGVCRVTLTKGEVRELADHGLSAQDKAAKQVLACSCIPLSDVVISQA